MCNWRNPKYWLVNLDDYKLNLIANGIGVELPFRSEGDLEKIKTGQVPLVELAKQELKRRELYGKSNSL